MTEKLRVSSCAVLAKRGLVWTLLLALCVQGGAAAVSALRGPAHVHAASGAPVSHPDEARRAGHFDAVLALAAGYAQRNGFPGRAHHRAHDHDEVQHHYHLPGSDAVRVLDENDDATTKGAAQTARGEPGSAVFLALIPDVFVLGPADTKAGFAIRPATKLVSCTADRIERPPRPLSA